MSIYESSIPDPELRKKFPYIVAWGTYLGSYDYFINNQLWAAEEEAAPADAIYRNKEGNWAVVGDIESNIIRAKVEQLAQQLRDGHVLRA